MTDTTEFHDRTLSLGLARVAEQAALASAALIGRGDEKGLPGFDIIALSHQPALDLNLVIGRAQVGHDDGFVVGHR